MTKKQILKFFTSFIKNSPGYNTVKDIPVFIVDTPQFYLNDNYEVVKEKEGMDMSAYKPIKIVTYKCSDVHSFVESLAKRKPSALYLYKIPIEAEMIAPNMKLDGSLIWRKNPNDDTFYIRMFELPNSVKMPNTSSDLSEEE